MSIVLLNSCLVSQTKDRIQVVSPHPRLGIGTIAAYAREKGFEVAVLDPQAPKMSRETLVQQILARKPCFLGFSAYTEEINDAALIAADVKQQAPETVILVGGYHASALPRQTLEEFAPFDITVIGPGEETLAEIAAGQSLETVNGIAYRAATGEILQNPPRIPSVLLNDLPFPAWDLFALDEYRKGNDASIYGFYLPVEPVRSCPFGCVFCFRNLGPKISEKSPARVLAELQHNISAYNTDSFWFHVGCFPLKRNHCVEICEGILREKMDIRWSSFTRVDLVDRELLTLMKRAGCESLNIGIESGSEEILKECSKGITPDRAVQSVKLCKEAGIRPTLNFIIGFPQETPETIKATKRLAHRLIPYAESINFAIMTPFPGTKVYDLAVRNEMGLSLRSTNWSDYGKQAGLALGHARFPDDQLRTYQARLYLSCYLRMPWRMLKLFSFARAKQLLDRLW